MNNPELLFVKKPVKVHAYQTKRPMDIQTLEGIMHADSGDWIVTGISGEQYPVKPDIFNKTYQRVFDDNQK